MEKDSVVVKERVQMSPRLIDVIRDISGIIIVKVGLEQKEYRPHKVLLAHHSEFFRKALQGDWKEADEKTVILEDVEPAIFNIFVNWLYTQIVPKTETDWELALEQDTRVQFNSSLMQIKTYVLGDRLLAQGFRKAINDQFVQRQPRRMKTLELYETAIYAWPNIPADRPILQFLADTHCEPWMEDYEGPMEKEVQHHLPHEFLVRVMFRFKYGNQPHYRTRCYLEHNSDVDFKECRTEWHMEYDANAKFGFFCLTR